MSENLFIIYTDTSDSRLGAWCFKKAFPSLNKNNFYLAKDRDHPPLLDVGRDIIILNFCYPQNIFMSVLGSSNTTLVLDNHTSSLFLASITSEKLHYVLDMGRSGSQMTWDYCFPQRPERPWYIDDKATNHPEVCRVLDGLSFYDTFEQIDLIEEKSREYYIEVGELLLKDDERKIEEICKGSIDGYVTSLINRDKRWKVRLVHSPKYFSNQVGKRLTDDEKCDFAMIYDYNLVGKFWKFVIVAKEGKRIDLNEIAFHLSLFYERENDNVELTLYDSNIYNFFSFSLNSF